jgi:hypothetical protein
MAAAARMVHKYMALHAERRSALTPTLLYSLPTSSMFQLKKPSALLLPIGGPLYPTQHQEGELFQRSGAGVFRCSDDSGPYPDAFSAMQSQATIGTPR